MRGYLPLLQGQKSQEVEMSFLGLERGSQHPGCKIDSPAVQSLGGIKGDCMGKVTSEPGHQRKDELTRRRIQKDISNRVSGCLNFHENVPILTHVLFLPCKMPFPSEFSRSLCFLLLHLLSYNKKPLARCLRTDCPPPRLSPQRSRVLGSLRRPSEM